MHICTKSLMNNTHSNIICNHPKCLLVVEGINKSQYILAMECYTATNMTSSKRISQTSNLKASHKGACAI